VSTISRFRSRHVTLPLGASVPPGPPAPADVELGTPGPTDIPISWEEVDGATEYEIEMGPSGGPYGAAPGSPVAAPSTGITIEGLSPGFEYCFRVRAITPEGPTLWSDEVCATTPNIPCVECSDPTPVNEQDWRGLSALPLPWTNQGTDPEPQYDSGGMFPDTGEASAYIEITGLSGDATSLTLAVEVTDLVKGDTWGGAVNMRVRGTLGETSAIGIEGFSDSAFGYGIDSGDHVSLVALAPISGLFIFRWDACGTESLSFYQDGVLVDESFNTFAQLPGWESSSVELEFGKYNYVGGFPPGWPGTVDTRVVKSAMWDCALTDAQVADVVAGWIPPVPTLQEAILALNPVGYWPLQETSGTVAADMAPSPVNGTYSGVTLASQAGADGFSYPRWNPISSADVMSVPDEADFSVDTNGLSFFFLTYPHSIGGTISSFFSKGAVGNYEYNLESSSSGQLHWQTFNLSGANSGQDRTSPTGVFAINNWAAYVLTTAGTGTAAAVEAYKNNNTPLVLTPANGSGVAGNGTAVLSVGNRFTGGATSPNANIAHFAVFPGVLSATDVQSLMTAAANEGWIP
jgi:hypothetical protein